MLTITHTHEAGTIIEGTSKGDGSAAALKGQRWRWSGQLGAWYVPHSRDKIADTYRISKTREALQAAGFTVEVDIDDTRRSVELIEADKADRADQRAGNLAVRADKLHEQADRHVARADRHSARFAGGQPILIGHHSEKTARNAQRKSHDAMRRAIDTQQAATDTANRADAAAAATGSRYSPVTVANRISKIEAEIRSTLRRIEGSTRTLFTDAAGNKQVEIIKPAPEIHAERLCCELDTLNEQLTYWKSIRADQIATGLITDYSRDTINAGDLVLIRGSWCTVVRANPKTVSVKNSIMMHPLKCTYAEIKQHRPAAQ